jgi:predicted PurR-regulated permease PerM
MNEQGRILDISWGTIFKIFIAIVCFYIIYQIKNILVWFIFALIISILFEPAIQFFKKLRIPRGLAVCFVYVAFFGILILIAYFTIPLSFDEIKQFAQILPQSFEKISPPLKGLKIAAFSDVESFVNALGGILNKITANVANILFAFFGGIFATIFILSLSIYLSLEEKGVERALVLFFPKKYEASVISIWERCQTKVSNWFLTRVSACLFVGVSSLVSFLIFSAPYPFSLAVLAGVLNFIPVVGPILTALFRFLIIALDNVSKAIFVVVVFILIQEIENHIFTPLISKKLVGLPPVLVLLSLSIGGILWGLLGAILAIPLAGIVYEFIKEFFEKRKSEKASTL